VGLISDIYPPEVLGELEESLDHGALTVVATPGSGATELVTTLASDTVLLRPREAGTPLGFRSQFANALVGWAAAQLSRGDSGSSLPLTVAALAVEFGARARDVVALANGDWERDVPIAHLADGLPERVTVVVDEAHLVESVAGPEALWALRNHRRVVLVTRPWFIDRLRDRKAAFFGHGRMVNLSTAKLRPPLANPKDAAFVVDRALANAELVAEVLRRGKGDVRRGWAEAVEVRRSVIETFLTAGFAIHQFAPSLLRAIAADEPPYAAIPGGSTARIANALRALRDNDFIYPPRPRRWRLADPAMGAALRSSAE
jgi:hypothetical protein